MSLSSQKVLEGVIFLYCNKWHRNSVNFKTLEDWKPFKQIRKFCFKVYKYTFPRVFIVSMLFVVTKLHNSRNQEAFPKAVAFSSTLKCLIYLKVQMMGLFFFNYLFGIAFLSLSQEKIIKCEIIFLQQRNQKSHDNDISKFYQLDFKESNKLRQEVKLI